MSNTHKIGFLQTRFTHPQPGGGEVHTEIIAEKLSQMGHDVTVFTDRADKQREISGGFALRQYDTPVDVNPINESVLARKARSELAECDMVFLTDDSAWQGSKIDTPTVMIFHIVWNGVLRRLGGTYGALTSKPQVSMYAAIEQRFVNDVDYAVSISPLMEDEIRLTGIDPDKIETIRNGVDTSKYAPVQTSFNDFTVHYQGRLVTDKNADKLVKAVSKSEENWRLKIGGDGPLKSTLQSQVQNENIENRVDILGYVEEQELPQLYAKSDVYILPSDYEGMPLTVLEAASCGTASVVSERAATDFVTPESGRILDSTSPRDIAETLDELYRNQAEVESMGHEARRNAEMYDWDTIASAYDTLISEAVN